jgi:hypothetical protein
MTVKSTRHDVSCLEGCRHRIIARPLHGIAGRVRWAWGAGPVPPWPSRDGARGRRCGRRPGIPVIAPSSAGCGRCSSSVGADPEPGRYRGGVHRRDMARYARPRPLRRRCRSCPWRGRHRGSAGS